MYTVLVIVHAGTVMACQSTDGGGEVGGRTPRYPMATTCIVSHKLYSSPGQA